MMTVFPVRKHKDSCPYVIEENDRFTETVNLFFLSPIPILLVAECFSDQGPFQRCLQASSLCEVHNREVFERSREARSISARSSSEVEKQAALNAWKLNT